MLEGKNLVKTYRHKDLWGENKTLHALNGVNFSLKRGEFCAIVGESGSGKSTLARILAGVVTSTQGEVTLNKKLIQSKSHTRSKELCKNVQLILQDSKSALDPQFAIYDCIAEPIQNLLKLSKEEETKRILALMDKMELPNELLKRKPHELSGGQQKRVCIARALAAEPSIIIFDEATSGLDVIVRKNILDLLVKLHKETDAAYLFITHDMDVALYIADRILVMKDGGILEQVQYKGDTSCFENSYSQLLLESMFAKTPTEFCSICKIEI